MRQLGRGLRLVLINELLEGLEVASACGNIKTSNQECYQRMLIAERFTQHAMPKDK